MFFPISFRNNIEDEKIRGWMSRARVSSVKHQRNLSRERERSKTQQTERERARQKFPPRSIDERGWEEQRGETRRERKKGTMVASEEPKDGRTRSRFEVSKFEGLVPKMNQQTRRQDEVGMISRCAAVCWHRAPHARTSSQSSPHDGCVRFVSGICFGLRARTQALRGAKTSS